LARKTLLLIAVGCAALSVSLAKPIAFDLAVGRASGHALVQIGFASFRLAFDSGQKCPNSNSCAGGVL
jgi:hypothetical protein